MSSMQTSDSILRRVCAPEPARNKTANRVFETWWPGRGWRAIHLETVRLASGWPRPVRPCRRRGLQAWRCSLLVAGRPGVWGPSRPAVPSEETPRHLTFRAPTVRRSSQRQNRSTSPKLLLFSSAHILPPSPPSPPAQSTPGLSGKSHRLGRCMRSLPCPHYCPSQSSASPPSTERPVARRPWENDSQRAASSSLPLPSHRDSTSCSLLTNSSYLAVTPQSPPICGTGRCCSSREPRGRRTKSALTVCGLDGVALLS